MASSKNDWYVKEFGVQKCSWHGGSNRTFVSMMAISHTRDLASIVIANSSDDQSNRICGEIAEKVLREFSKTARFRAPKSQ